MEIDSRLQTDDVADTVAFVTNGSADLANGVDEFHAQHPLGGRQLDLAGELVDVLDQRAQQHARALGSLGAHGIDHIGGEVGVEFARRGHCDGWRVVVGGVQQEAVWGNHSGMEKPKENHPGRGRRQTL